jgi:protein SCO1/2
MIRAAYGFIVAFCVCTGALLVTSMAPTASRPAGSGPSDASDLAYRPHPGARLPLAATLVDEPGRAVTLGEYFTKSPVILVLEYLRCTSLCSVTLRNLVDALNGLPLEAGRDYELVTVSIDQRDKPADALAARAKYVGLLDHGDTETGIHFLTAADPAQAREIADTAGFPYRYDTLLDAYIHPAGFVIAAPDGAISRYVEGVAVSPRDLLGALADARQGRSQGPLTRLLLLCRVHGAPLARLTVPVLAALTIADLAAALTLIAIFAAIWRRRA